MNKFVITDNLLYNSFSEKIALDRIETLICLKDKALYVSYCFVPLILFLKILYPTICIAIGAVLFDYKITIIRAFKICLVAEIIFVIANTYKMFYFLTTSDAYTIEQIQDYYPLSIVNYINIKNIPQYLIYPVQKINLFEIIYCFALAYGFQAVTHKSFKKSFLFILINYGIGLLILITFIIFVNINLTTSA